jgi:uncharacterized protein YbjT (DUF2867 family)
MGITGIDSRPVAVTGANGFVGSHLVPVLRAAGFPVRAIVRTTGAAAGLRAQGCEVALADVRSRASLDDPLAGCRAVIHLVAVIREHDGVTFDAVNRGGTANVAAAARDGGVGRVVHFSVLGAGPSAPRYPRSRWAGEEALRGAGVPFVIFRPSFIFGGGGGIARQLSDLVRLGPWYPIKQLTGWEGPLPRLAAVTPVVPVMGSGEYQSMPVHAGDLMEAVTQAVKRDDVLGRVFEIGGPQVVTFNALLDAVAEELHLRRWMLHLPLPLARALAWTLAVLPRPPITREELDALLIDNVCDNTDVTQTFGLTLTPLREALRAALASELRWSP